MTPNSYAKDIEYDRFLNTIWLQKNWRKVTTYGYRNFAI